MSFLLLVQVEQETHLANDFPVGPICCFVQKTFVSDCVVADCVVSEWIVVVVAGMR